MRAAIRYSSPITLALMLAACGGPATPPAAPKAATPAPSAPSAAAKPATSPLLDPKGTLDAARSAASAANAAVAARQPVDAKAGLTPQAPGTVAATTAASALTPSAPKYDAAGRRDPFESLESRLGSDRSTVANSKLTGVIHSDGTSFALVETADGIGYILKPGDTLADGRLIEIGPAVAVFAIAPKPGTTNNRVVLKLAGD